MTEKRSVQVLSPYDRSSIGTLPEADEAHCMSVLEQSHALYEQRDQWLPKHERVAILSRLAELVSQRREQLTLQAAREGGKPYADSLIEVERAEQGILAAVHELHHLGGAEIPMGLTASSSGRMAFTYREPRGVVLSISAFNHPVNLIVHQVIPALAVGAPVIIKPAPDTPLSCRSIVQLLYEAGLPEAWCRMVLCENEVTQKLVGDRRTAFLSFIGSHRVGWYLRSKLAPGAACALEHGGVAPVIVDATAKLDDAVPLLVKGGYYHAGQVCVSVQRIYVQESKRERLCEQLVGAISPLRVGDPTAKDTDVGPLIRPSEVDRVATWVDEAVRAGARAAIGGKRLSETCYAPTLLIDPPDDARVSREEIFGPVVSVYGYGELDEAIARANAPDAFFQAAVFTQDLGVALRAHRRLRGMSVMVNDHTAFRVDSMPFGGHLASGLGLGGIGYSMRDMSLERMFVVRSSEL